MKQNLQGAGTKPKTIALAQPQSQVSQYLQLIDKLGVSNKQVVTVADIRSNNQ